MMYGCMCKRETERWINMWSQWMCVCVCVVEEEAGGRVLGGGEGEGDSSRGSRHLSDRVCVTEQGEETFKPGFLTLGNNS